MITKLILLYSFTQAGDTSHIKALEKQLTSDIKFEKIVTFNADLQKDKLLKEFENFNKLEHESTKNDIHHLVLTAGEKGGEALEIIANNNYLTDKSYVYWGTHQFIAKIKNYKNLKLDHLQIPASAIDNSEKEDIIKNIANVTKTLTVPNINPSIQELKESYDKWEKHPLINIEKKYITVLLPGDAPDPTNKMQYFTKESALKLFQHLHKIWINDSIKRTVILQNGPRTGKYDPATGAIVCAHEYKTGEAAEKAIDKISLYFSSLLAQEKIPFFFKNFSFELNAGQRKKHSAFEPILYLAYKTQSTFIFPGESVSLIGQLPLYLEPQNVIAFYSSSMNQEHKLALEEAFKRGHLSKFDDVGNIILPKQPHKLECDDTAQVASDILKGYRKKF